MKAKDLIPLLQVSSETKREANLLGMLKAGYVAQHVLQFMPVTIQTNKAKLIYYVSADYIAIGDDTDYLLTPMYPGTAQAYIDDINWTIQDPANKLILPTKLMVDQIYKQASLKFVPIPISPKQGEPRRGSTETYIKHSDAIKRQRGAMPLNLLTAGHKKDIVLSNMLLRVRGKVAIYGWHEPPGQAIQPLTTIHSSTYVDYSHGVRLCKLGCLLNDMPASLITVLQDRNLATTISSEGVLHILSYAY